MRVGNVRAVVQKRRRVYCTFHHVLRVVLLLFPLFLVCKLDLTLRCRTRVQQLFRRVFPNNNFFLTSIWLQFFDFIVKFKGSNVATLSQHVLHILIFDSLRKKLLLWHIHGWTLILNYNVTLFLHVGTRPIVFNPTIHS